MNKISLPVILGVSFIIFSIDSLRPKTLEVVRSSILMTISPAIEAMTMPVDFFNYASMYFGGIEGLHSENNRLSLENDRLRNYKNLYMSTRQDNEELRELLHYNKRLEKTFDIARIISDTGGIYARTLLLNVGESDEVYDGLGVVTNKGLLGRTIDTRYNTTRVLLLSDINSEIPVVIENIKESGILVGNYNNYPILKFARSTNNIEVGQRVLTSGHGGVFPPGLEIGKVVSTIDFIKVKLYADINDSSYVRIVKYEFANKSKKAKK